MFTIEEEPRYVEVEAASRNQEMSTLHSKKFTRWRYWAGWTPWVIHLMIFLAYACLFNDGHIPYPFSNSIHDQGCDSAFPDIYNNLRVEAKQRKTIGTMTEDPSSFQGRPSESVHRAWRDLLSVGIVGITAEEAARLPLHTSPNILDPSQYVVELNVYHQLHCLHMLRMQVWEPKQLSWQNNEEVGWWEYHIDHCIEHLRQTLICHADTTPQRFLYDHDRKSYTLPSRQEFVCKDFDAIHAWASARNSTGLSPMKTGGRDTKEAVHQ